MMNPMRQSDVVGVGVGVGLVALILGTLALLASLVFTHPIWLVLASTVLLLGAIAVKVYLAGSTTT